MSDLVQIEIVRVLGTSVPAALAAWWAYRASQGVKEVKKNTDGMTTALVALTAKSSKAEGNLEGRAELSEETK